MRSRLPLMIQLSVTRKFMLLTSLCSTCGFAMWSVSIPWAIWMANEISSCQPNCSFSLFKISYKLPLRSVESSFPRGYLEQYSITRHSRGSRQAPKNLTMFAPRMELES